MNIKVEVDLDWRAPGHVDLRAELPCRVCTARTYHRDDDHEPCHRTCAGQEIADEIMRLVSTAGIGR